MTPLACRKHTRIFQLTEAHFDELIRIMLDHDIEELNKKG